MFIQYVADAWGRSVCCSSENHVCVQPSRAVQAIHGWAWSAYVSAGVYDSGFLNSSFRKKLLPEIWQFDCGIIEAVPVF